MLWQTRRVNTEDNARLGIGLMLLAMFLIVCGDALGKYLTQTYAVLQVLWIRSWVFLVFALWWAGRNGLIQTFRSQRITLQLSRSFLLVLEMLIFLLSFQLLPLAEVTAVGAVTPLFVTVLAVIFLAERVGWQRWFAIAMGFIGVLIVTRPGMGVFGWAMLLPLLGVLLWGLYQILSRLVSRWDNAETSLLYTAIVGFIVLSVIAPWQWQTPDAISWLALTGLGLLNSCGHFALIKALSMTEASILQPFTYTMLVWATLFGWLVFSDLPDQWAMLGSLLIVSGGLYAWLRERRLAKV